MVRTLEGSGVPQTSYSSMKRDLAIDYLIMSINAYWKAAVMNFRDPRRVWEILQKSYQDVSEEIIDEKLTKIYQIRMGTQ